MRPRLPARGLCLERELGGRQFLCCPLNKHSLKRLGWAEGNNLWGGERARRAARGLPAGDFHLTSRCQGARCSEHGPQLGSAASGCSGQNENNSSETPKLESHLLFQPPSPLGRMQENQRV